MMEKENMSHKIDEDLARRNRNWDVIDGKFIEMESKADQLKVAKLEKELQDYKTTMASVNVNQEAKQTASGYGIVSLPKNAANGQVSVSVQGNTYTNLLGEKGKGNSTDGWLLKQHITSNGTEIILDSLKPVKGLIPANIKSGNKYLLIMDIKIISGTTGTIGVSLDSPTGRVSNTTRDINQLPYVFTTTGDGDRLNVEIGVYGDRVYHVKDILLVDLTLAGDENLTLQELINKYSYVSNTKSTISASRLKSVGKNLVFGTEAGTINAADGRIVSSTTRVRTLPIPVSRGEYYTRSILPGYRHIGGFVLFDRNLNHIETRNLDTLVVSQDGFIRLIYARTDDSTVTSDDKNKIQLEQGTIATPYEPYTESTQYLPNVAELRSLPNGVKDEIRVSGGKAELVKRVSNIATIKSTDVTLVQKHSDIVILARVPFTAFENIKPSTVAYENGQITVFNKVPAISSPGVDDIGKWYLTSNSVLTFVLEIGTTLEQAKEQLAGTELIYQLAEPIITPIDVSGTLLSNSSGTVYVEPVVADAGVYSDGISVLHEGLPIKAVEKVSQVDFATGLETELDIEGIEISTDGLSFTHPELEDGDIVFFEYEYNLEGTTGETEIEFYDSRYTIKDSVTDAFYKWNVAVANGVPSIELVEV